MNNAVPKNKFVPRNLTGKTCTERIPRRNERVTHCKVLLKFNGAS
jgi:hypothetical protein